MHKLIIAIALALASFAPAQAQTVQAAVAPDVWDALQLCSFDNLFHFKTSTCPSGWVPSPSLAGLPPISDGLSLTALLPTAIPPSSAPDIVGAFRFICNAGQVLADDPIVYPGQPGKSHLHQFYGNTKADAYSTYSSLRTTGDSTCMTTPFNRSGYWMPAMLNGLGYVVRPDFVSIYYKRLPLSDPRCNDPARKDLKAYGICTPLPNGLKFIFGYDMLTNEAPTGEAWFNCQGPGAIGGHYASLDAIVAANACPVGAQLGAVIEAPTCWDGKNIDSPNHRDHMSYPTYGTWGYKRCDAAHPYLIPAFTLGAWYRVTSPLRTWSLASDAMRPDLPKGKTFHADFWMAWNPDVHMLWEDNCINKMLNCAAGLLGNGQKIPGALLRTDPGPMLVPVP